MKKQVKKQPAKKNASQEQAVLVCTEHRGVFFGYASSWSKESITLQRARNVVYWPREQRGFVGLATEGPLSGARVGPAANCVLYGITCVVACTEKSVAAFEAAPWSG